MFNKFTELSNNYIDWSRIGELIRSGNHHYSLEEIAPRGAIILTTAVSCFLGAQFNDKNKTNCSNTTASIAAGVLGFIVSHSFVIAPLIYKRYKMSSECQQLVAEIHQDAAEIQDMPIEALSSLIDKILKLTLASETRSNASQTWGRRASLLEKLSTQIHEHNSDLLSDLKTGHVDSVLSKLEHSEYSSQPKPM